ncbi:MAG: hypothetical protein O3B01_09635 [Planctomycetota bacterium]|nr:hypothetical protein [Planctomycetota bacterium]
MGKRDSRIPPDLQRLCRRLEKHRNSKGKGHRLPSGIWRSAAELAREHGVSLVARVLSLDYYTLKERAVVAGGNRGESVSAAFVELRPSSSNRDDSGVTIDLHSESGDRMTMRLPMLDGLDAVELVQAFWRSS